MRLVRANSFDLSLLQFDPDLTFAVFFLNADRTIYGRYGSRSSFSSSERDVSLKSLQLAMNSALELHSDYPANAKSLVGKSGQKPLFATVDQSRWFQSSNRSVETQTCMHCHHIGNARQMQFVDQEKPLPDDELFAWPMPDAIGLHLDPRARATVQRVAPDSPAARNGLTAGDEIVQLNGQPMISIADVQWVLHQTSTPQPDDAVSEQEVSTVIDAVLLRDGQRVETKIKLPQHWRRATDISWRTTTTLLRDTVLGSLKLQDCSNDERQTLGVPLDRLALRVEYAVWETTPAGRAGIQRRDIIVEFAGNTDRMTESELLRRLLQREITGDTFELTVLRNGERLQMQLER